MITVGIAIYNGVNHVRNLILSILALTRYPREHYRIVVCDDGSEDRALIERFAAFCRPLDVELIVNDGNRGVPYSWNRLVACQPCAYAVILNDDTRVIDPDWLRHIVYFFEQNPTAGIVDWREYLIGPRGEFLGCTTSNTAPVPRYKIKPSGPFFALRADLWRRVHQPDGSVGFWADLLAYREERDIAAEFHALGHGVFQLPFAMEHFKSQTFALNPTMRLRTRLSPYLPLDEFATLDRDFPVPETAVVPAGNGGWRGLLRRWRGRLRPAPSAPPTKLAYSRAMFAKKWRGRSLYGFPGETYLRDMENCEARYLAARSPVRVRFLDSDLLPAEADA